jgi:hypothetical protein
MGWRLGTSWTCPLETLRTKANTSFVDWRREFNKELQRLGMPRSTVINAEGHYQIGQSPETAADYDMAVADLCKPRATRGV